MPKSKVVSVEAKGRCCKDKPRCKRCPVVLNRLDREGYAHRSSRRSYMLSRALPKKVLAKARGA